MIQGQGLEVQGQGLVNLSSRILEDKDFKDYNTGFGLFKFCDFSL